ncbi:MAG: hypothetical protein LQ339_004605 [Xanthoria mediterranea]|nr:MAG: hypothetical protein LQ339_004605 [Xanthoria mediterranea]
MSPSSPTAGDTDRSKSKSKRLARLKELLTPIKASASPITPTSPSALRRTEEATDADDDGFIKEDPIAVRSDIDFFPRHPGDSSNPLTFLGGGSGAGPGDPPTTGTTAAGNPAGSGKEMQNMAQAESSSKPDSWESWDSVFLSSVETDGRSLADSRGSEDERRSPPIPMLMAPRKFTGDGRRLPRYPQTLKETILRTRPTTFHELPGRFRSKESCWYCCDGVVGERCEVCGLVVQKVSPERWG